MNRNRLPNLLARFWSSGALVVLLTSLFSAEVFEHPLTPLGLGLAMLLGVWATAAFAAAAALGKPKGNALSALGVVSGFFPLWGLLTARSAGQAQAVEAAVFFFWWLAGAALCVRAGSARPASGGETLQ